MQTRKAAVLSIIAIALAACSAPAPQVNAAAEEEAIRAMSMRWLELDRAEDHAGIAALFAADGVIYRDEDEPAVGTVAIQAALLEDDAGNPNEVVDWTTDKVEISSAGDMAVEHGTWTSTGSRPTGDGSSRGRFMTVDRRIDGEWKVVADMSVTTTPAPAVTSTAM
ncbi:MAG: YybH family protein [Longimicrobiales bacterium]